MSAWESLKTTFGSGFQRVSSVPLAPHQVRPPVPDDPLEPYASYFQIWLDEVALAKTGSWGRDRFPVVQSEVRLQFAGQVRSLPTLSRPPEDQLVRGVRLNYPLTPLLPFNGGQVEVQATLLALPGRDNFASAIDALTKLGGLIGPPIAQAIPLAGALSDAIRGLFDDGDAKLGLHQTFVAGERVGPSSMRACSIAVIGDATRENSGAEQLRVRNNRLESVSSRDGMTKPLEGVDYMLLRIEGSSERPDWRFPDIGDPLKRAQIALAQGNKDTGAGYRAVAITAALESCDIAERDRSRVIKLIKRLCEEAENEAYGATGPEPPDLDRSRGRAISREQDAAEGPVGKDELFT
jgi:hypothetical protein